MTDAPSPPPPTSPSRRPARTLEQQDSIRRKSLPIAIGGSLCAILGLTLGAMNQVTAYHPPSFLAMNLSFSAMLIGVGILLYARGTPRTGWAAVFALAAVLIGLSGTGVYARKAVKFRELCENRELDNLTDIAGAARKYASQHGGVYPADLLVMLDEKLITPENLQSPYGMKDLLFNHFEEARAQAKSRTDLLKAVETQADYIYLGDGLKSVPEALEGKILVVASANVVLHEGVSVSFANGSSEFSNLDEIGGIRTENDKARQAMGLGPMQLPSSIQKALDAAAELKRGGATRPAS